MDLYQPTSVDSIPSDPELKTDVEKGSSANVQEYDVLHSPEVIDAARERRYVTNSVYMRSANTQSIHRLVRRIDLRMIPLAMFVYLLCFLNRANIVS